MTNERPDVILYSPFFDLAIRDLFDREPLMLFAGRLTDVGDIRHIVRVRLTEARHEVQEVAPMPIEGAALARWRDDTKTAVEPVLGGVLRIYADADSFKLYAETLKANSNRHQHDGYPWAERVYTPLAKITVRVLLDNLTYFRKYLAVSLDEYGTVHMGKGDNHAV